MPKRNFDASVVARRLNDKVNAQNIYLNQYYGTQFINNPQVSNNSSSVVPSYHAGAQTIYSEGRGQGYIANLGGIANFFIDGTSAAEQNITVPDAPTNVTATYAGPARAEVLFTPPANNGGSSIINYIIRAFKSDIFYDQVTVTTPPYYIYSLTPGLYKIYVSAVNIIGESVPSDPGKCIYYFVIN